MFEQPFATLIFLGLAFKAGGFLLRDELNLRILVLVGMACDIAFFVLQAPANWGSVLTNSVLVAINLVLIGIIVVERSTLFMSAREKKLFESFKTLTPGQFRRINRWVRWTVAPRETVLLEEGKLGVGLYYLDTGAFSVTKQGQDYTARGPAFAGEIMLLQGGGASATVTVAQGTVYAEWSAEKLRVAMARSRPLENALIARFGYDLAEKLRHSVPMERVEDGLSRGIGSAGS